ncbi:HAD-IC family P-type ATPase [Streptomyces melanosporofaciens]|uniref:ATPase, P-type (Transporting), HAD superfamily, subfamily IC n=1 Tax=Streptomyces melanosporofaciens TaxID=67327 RepID=A0A1H4XTV7_STRMJ|nr:HAD-IC family P-type ATPase [Streptomyces melanosporofaciens]SED08570.1 ATPase, P-type (transporting), HAD superfamily, subfamily IC [Streptomyces melanosporofaciens]
MLCAFRENGTELPDGSGASRGAGSGEPGAPGALWSAGVRPVRKAARTVVRAGAPGVMGAASARFAALHRNTTSLVNAVREELHDPLTPVLALGAAASAAVGSGVDSFLVVSVMAGNAVISGAQRLRAERSLRGLLLSERMNGRLVDWAPAMSLADGVAADREVFFAGLTAAPVRTVAAEELRVGDIIALRPSDVVPADARLLVSDRLELDEAGLTGESGPVAKDPAATPGADLADRSCMVYEGCTVLAGTGYAVVVAAGPQTEAGRAAELAGHATAPIGIEGRLAALTKVALPATGLGGAAVTLLGLMRGVPVREALSTGVAIAVAAVPEGLPLVATVAQSAAARRLSHRGVLTRSARVLEALGRVDVVCFDKTGTLTEGRLAVARVAGYDHELPTGGALGMRLLRTAARACPEREGGRALAHATDQAVIDADPTRILDALQEGRALWRSVRDAVAILVGGNAGEVAFTVLGAAVAGRAPLGTRQLLLVNPLTDMLPALAVALARSREQKSGEDPLVGGPASALFGSDLGRILAVRGSATALGAAAAWQCGRMTGRARRASTMGLAALVGTQLGQTFMTDWPSSLVLVTSVASADTLFAIVETPMVSHFFGCTPLGPMAWSVVGTCSAAATLGAAVAPRLLFPPAGAARGLNAAPGKRDISGVS